MRLFLKYIFLLLLIAFLPLQGGSYFSSQLHGMGIRQYLPSVRGIGMGMTGIATSDSLLLGNYSISQWRYVTNTRLTIGLRYNRIDTEVDGGSFRSASGGFAGISLAIPIQSQKWVIGLNFQPYSTVDFKSSQEEESGGISFTQNNILSGTIGKAQLNLVWSPVPRVGLSVNGNFYFGTIEDRYEYSFTDASFRDISHGVEYRITGPGIGFSADIHPLNWLVIAGFADTRPTLKVKTAYQSSGIFPDSLKRNLDSFPLHFGIGSATKLSSRWNLALDYSYQYWSQTLKVAGPEYEDWYNLGIGIERAKSQKRKKGFINELDLRGGFSVTRIGYKFNNEPVYEYGLHFGMGIPFGLYGNRLDFAISGGYSGDKTKNLVQERFVKLHVSLAIGERWFQKDR